MNLSLPGRSYEFDDLARHLCSNPQATGRVSVRFAYMKSSDPRAGRDVGRLVFFDNETTWRRAGRPISCIAICCASANRVPERGTNSIAKSISRSIVVRGNPNHDDSVLVIIDSDGHFPSRNRGANQAIFSCCHVDPVSGKSLFQPCNGERFEKTNSFIFIPRIDCLFCGKDESRRLRGACYPTKSEPKGK